MRSAVHTAFGDPAELLHLGDMPVPEPGPGQVRVRTLLSPIHNHDLWTVRGEYGYKPDLPAIGGSEAVAGRPSRTAAVLARSRRCTTALVKWVVPIITTSMALASSFEAASTAWR